MEEKDNPIIGEIREQVAELQKQGFEAEAIAYPMGDGYETIMSSGNGFGYDDEMSKCLQRIAKASTPNKEFQQICTDFQPQETLRPSDPLFQKTIIPVNVEGVGSPGKGYVPWGPQNRLPNFIFQTGYSLPYIARSLSYSRDTIVGLGCEYMYRFTRYTNGTVTTKMVPYEDAGLLIRHRIMELEAAQTERKADAGFVNYLPQGEPKPGTVDYEIKLLREDYAEWERVSAKVTKFCQENSISKHMAQCMTNFVPLEMYFPLIGLSKGEPGKDWNPEIVSIEQVDCVAARVEEMDDKGNINYVYKSNVWRGYGGYSALTPQKGEIVAYPALPEEGYLQALRKIVKQKKEVGVRSRPLTFCIPRRMPSMNSLYYTQPTWFSVYSSKLYDYAFTMISDRAAAKLNGTMFGKIIFVNKPYMERLMANEGCTTKEQRIAFRKKFKESIDEFLKNRQNNGATAMFDSDLGPDGKPVDAIRIVDVPLNAANVQANKTELTEISNAIFLTMGIHSAIIGNDISSSGSNGGTVQRELDLLKQKQLSPMQKDYLDFLNFIRDFNNWDPKHGVWVSKQMSLTTLDASKTGTATITGDGQKI